MLMLMFILFITVMVIPVAMVIGCTVQLDGGKINELNNMVVVEQNVLQFDIPMDDTMSLECSKQQQQLRHNEFDILPIQPKYGRSMSMGMSMGMSMLFIGWCAGYSVQTIAHILHDDISILSTCAILLYLDDVTVMLVLEPIQYCVLHLVLIEQSTVPVYHITTTTATITATITINITTTITIAITMMLVMVEIIYLHSMGQFIGAVGQVHIGGKSYPNMLHHLQLMPHLQVLHQLHINHQCQLIQSIKYYHLYTHPLYYHLSNTYILCICQQLHRLMKQESFEQYFKLNAQCGLQSLITVYAHYGLGYDPHGNGRAYLGQGEWAKYNLYWDFLEEWKVRQLDLNYDKPTIPKLIKISFPSLQKLYLASNRIHSIECLIELNAPHLHSIKLSDNQICSIKVLRKMWVSRGLKYLDLNLNNIGDISILGQINFDPEVEQLGLELCHRLNEADLRNIFKCTFTKLKCLRSNADILNPCFFPLIKRSRLYI